MDEAKEALGCLMWLLVGSIAITLIKLGPDLLEWARRALQP